MDNSILTLAMFAPIVAQGDVGVKQAGVDARPTGEQQDLVDGADAKAIAQSTSEEPVATGIPISGEVSGNDNCPEDVRLQLDRLVHVRQEIERLREEMAALEFRGSEEKLLGVEFEDGRKIVVNDQYLSELRQRGEAIWKEFAASLETDEEAAVQRIKDECEIERQEKAIRDRMEAYSKRKNK